MAIPVILPLARQRVIETQLAETVLTAPADAVVEVFDIRPGTLVTPNRALATLIERDLWVRVYVPESQIGRLRLGLEVAVRVDSFPGRTFRGKITQVRKAALVVQNVVTYMAIISAPNPDLTLLPGMTTNVRITVANRDQVRRTLALAARTGGTAVRDDTTLVVLRRRPAPDRGAGELAS